MLLARRNSNWLPDVFNDFFDSDFVPKAASSVTSPAINVIERHNEYVVELAAPGMTKQDFKVSLDADDNLLIALHKEPAQQESGSHYLRREFSYYTQFQQTLILPDDVNLEGINANVENGILTVVLPKKSAEERKKEARTIEIG